MVIDETQSQVYPSPRCPPASPFPSPLGGPRWSCSSLEIEGLRRLVSHKSCPSAEFRFSLDLGVQTVSEVGSHSGA